MTILLMVYLPYQDPYPWIIEEIFRFRSGHEHENDNRKVKLVEDFLTVFNV